ncbi:CoA-binding protein [Singulisphaera rosea]
MDGDRTQVLEGIAEDLDGILSRLVSLGDLPEVEELVRAARSRIVLLSGHRGPRVAVVGASTDRDKYGNKAVRAFLNAGFDVYPINPKAEVIEGLKSYPSLDALPVDHLDRVTLYVPPSVGINVLEQAVRKGVGEVWLNPGSESPELIARAESLGLDVIQACSIIAVGENPAQL